LETFDIIDSGKVMNDEELQALLKRIANVAGGEGILTTCWMENCNAPWIAMLRNHKGAVALMCKRHLRRLKQGKDRQVKFLSFQPQEQASAS
jgi:hypothetical protein